MKMIQKFAPVFVTGAAILWGILVIFIKNLSSAGLESMEIVTLRVYGASLVLFIGLLIYNKRLLKIRLKDCWCFVGTGVVSIVFFSYCYFKNVTVSSVAVSSILMYTSPIWVTLLARPIFGEKIGKRKLIALGMAFAGCVLVSGITGGVGMISAEGLLLGLGSGIGYGLYSIYGRIATVWVVISLTVAVFIGIAGRQLYPTTHLTATDAENIFITLATSSLPAILAGFVMAGILAATISSSDSYLLIAASACAKNIYQGVCNKKATDKQVMRVTRITLLVIALIAMVIAMDQDSVIFKIVSFAWAGFGATFGPIMLFSLFWRRTNKAGAIAGMIGGAGMVFAWKLGISKLGGAFAIYELLPAFIFSCICIVIASLVTAPPSKEIQEDFDAVCGK